MNMIEKVAIALAMSQNPGNWEVDFSEDHKKLWRIRAKVAIEAMHEPTEAMKKAPIGEADNVSNYLDDYSAEQVWQAMIDAALKEE